MTELSKQSLKSKRENIVKVLNEMNETIQTYSTQVHQVAEDLHEIEENAYVYNSVIEKGVPIIREAYKVMKMHNDNIARLEELKKNWPDLRKELTAIDKEIKQSKLKKDIEQYQGIFAKGVAELEGLKKEINE